MKLLWLFVVFHISAPLIFVLLAFPVSAVEEIQVPQFKNIDEMIGWVKAKGDCEKMVQDPKFVKEPKPFGQRCEIRIDLPNDEKLERNGKGKGVWKVWAWVKLAKFDQELWGKRYFSVTIIKS